MKENKLIFISLLVYSAFCIFSIVWFSIKQHLINIVFSIVFFFTGFVPFLVEYVVNLKESSSFFLSYLVFIALSLIGPAYDLYSILKNLDTFIHLFSAFLVTALGFSLGTKFINSPKKEKQNFFGCLLFGFFFCLSVGLIWELLEYFGTVFFKVDNQEDTLLTSFISYGLSGTRDFVTTVENITQTVIYYTNSDGSIETIKIAGGYYDLGLIDTILDMLACLVGSIVFAIVSLISFSSKKLFIKNYIPVSTTIDSLTEETCLLDTTPNL